MGYPHMPELAESCGLAAVSIGVALEWQTWKMLGVMLLVEENNRHRSSSEVEHAGFARKPLTHIPAQPVSVTSSCIAAAVWTCKTHSPRLGQSLQETFCITTGLGKGVRQSLRLQSKQASA